MTWRYRTTDVHTRDTDTPWVREYVAPLDAGGWAACARLPVQGALLYDTRPTRREAEELAHAMAQELRAMHAAGVL